jgi:transposase-like protein
VASKRKIEDEAEARRCLAAAKRKGLSVGDWARAHDIDGRSLNAWRVNLGRRDPGARPRRRKSKAEAMARALVELVPASPSVTVAGRGRYVLEVARARVEFGDDVSVETLHRVLEALRSC